MTRYLTREELLFIHRRLMDQTGGSHAVRKARLLPAVIEHPQVRYAAGEVYPDLFSKGAAMLESLMLNRPFMEGNKRTAITAVGVFLEQNGYRITASDPELGRFVQTVARMQMEFEAIGAWLRRHCLQASEPDGGR